LKIIELEPGKISGIFLQIDNRWHTVREVNVDYDEEKRRGKLEIKYGEMKNREDQRIMTIVPYELISDLKAFGVSDVKETIFLVKLEANRKISWSLTTRREVEKNPDFASILEH